MRNLFWIFTLFIGVGLGGACAWYFANSQPDSNTHSLPVELKQPNLSEEPSKAGSSHISAGEVVDVGFDDPTRAKPLSVVPEIVEISHPNSVVETGVVVAVETTVTGVSDVLAGAVETTIDIIEAPVADANDVFNIDSDKDAIAVLAFKTMGGANSFNKDTGDILCDAFVSEIDSDEYAVFERLQLKSLLEEKGFQASTLVDNPAGAARFGKLAKVRYVVLGSIASLGGHYHLSGRVVDCTSGKVGKRGWVVFSSMTQWPGKVPQLVNLLGLSAGSQSETSSGGTEFIDQGNELVDVVNPDADFAVSISTAQNKQTYLQGEYIQFVVSAERNCFVTLITVDSAGEMTLLLPNMWQTSAFVPGNIKLTIPSDEMGFRFPIRPPYGETTVKAIATLQPLLLSGVNAKGINEDGFVTLDKGVKAIGVEGVTPNPLVANDDVGLADLFSSTQWATAELIIITAKEKLEILSTPKILSEEIVTE
jgi:TolB-like protein